MQRRQGVCFAVRPFGAFLTVVNANGKPAGKELYPTITSSPMAVDFEHFPIISTEDTMISN